MLSRKKSSMCHNCLLKKTWPVLKNTFNTHKECRLTIKSTTSMLYGDSVASIAPRVSRAHHFQTCPEYSELSI